MLLGARYQVREGDLLMAINGDTAVVTQDYLSCIEPLLKLRPLKLTFCHPFEQGEEVERKTAALVTLAHSFLAVFDEDVR